MVVRKLGSFIISLYKSHFQMNQVFKHIKEKLGTLKEIKDFLSRTQKPRDVEKKV